MKPNYALLVGATLAAASALGQDYPAKPIRVIVPYAPGGGLDIVGRPITQRLSELYSQPVLLDNRPGAGTVIGTSVAAKSPADGYTLLLTLSALTIGPAVNPK